MYLVQVVIVQSLYGAMLDCLNNQSDFLNNMQHEQHLRETAVCTVIGRQKVLRSLIMLIVLCLKIVIIIPNMFSFVEVTNSAQLHLQLLSHNSILVALSFCVSPTKFQLLQLSEFIKGLLHFLRVLQRCLFVMDNLRFTRVRYIPTLENPLEKLW